VKAWDIDVRADFAGLPKGSGSVKKGEAVWEAQCASCHGTFGESNEIFTPIVGGTTKKDMETGRVAALLPGANTPQRTTMMKLSSISTLWDYINRAMPWTAPKTLTTEEVYAVSAYILNLANVVPDDFVLSHTNMADVQARLPNRNGKVIDHAMWPGGRAGAAMGVFAKTSTKPDVQGSACMNNCVAEPRLASFLPDHARNAHGNLAEQQRGIGAMRGADTTKASASPISAGAVPLGAGAKLPGGAPAAEPVAVATAAAAKPATPEPEVKKQPLPSKEAGPSATKTGVSDGKPLLLADVKPAMDKSACLACHGLDNKAVGPAIKDIAAKYKDRADGAAYLAGKIKNGGQGVWGPIPMPAQTISEADAKRVAAWIMGGAPR
jgi:S-disulfanyl-L-cysteine oxidoreductase SoxD